MSCTVCNHPERQAIDLALLDQTATLSQLSDQYHLSKSALHRHKQHLLQKMARKEHRFRNILRESCIFILNSFLPPIMQVVQQASSEGNSRLILQGARQGTDIIKFLHKLDFSLDLETVYRLLQFVRSRGPGRTASR